MEGSQMDPLNGDADDGLDGDDLVDRQDDWIDEGEEEDMPGMCQALRPAGEALLVRWEWGDEELVPRSVIAEGSEVEEPGDTGTLTAKRWWAVKGDRLVVAHRKLAAMRRTPAEEPFSAELFIRWKTQALASPTNPLAPTVLRLLRMVVAMAQEQVNAKPEM
jgi:hypothetical protein